MCIDYRNLNKITKLDKYPLPNIEDCLLAIGKCKYATSIDLNMAYHQLAVREEDIEKTAFITADGSYEYIRMPFRLCNASSF